MNPTFRDWLILILNGLVVTGVWTLFRKQMIFDEVGDWAFRTWPEWLYKPTIGCPPCMASVWGTTVFWLTHPFTPPNVILYPFYVLALCGFMKVLVILVLNRE